MNQEKQGVWTSRLIIAAVLLIVAVLPITGFFVCVFYDEWVGFFFFLPLLVAMLIADLFVKNDQWNGYP